MSTNIINDGICPRCKTNHCEDDNEHDNRLFWTSNTDGTEVCRACIRKEDEEEDEDEEETDEQMKARGAMDEDGFVVCGHCGKGGGSHATEDCPDHE
jgi:hypothetical protein